MLFICVVVFLGVFWYIYGIYYVIYDGKKKWLDFGVGVVVGIGLLILIIYFVIKVIIIM